MQSKASALKEFLKMRYLLEVMNMTLNRHQKLRFDVVSVAPTAIMYHQFNCNKKFIYKKKIHQNCTLIFRKRSFCCVPNDITVLNKFDKKISKMFAYFWDSPRITSMTYLSPPVFMSSEKYITSLTICIVYIGISLAQRTDFTTIQTLVIIHLFIWFFKKFISYFPNRLSIQNLSV